jgi:protein pelota
MLRNFDLDILKVILLASPGFTATSVRDHILAQATLIDAVPVLRAKPKFLVVHSSTGHLHSLNEVLKSDEVKAKLADTKFARESRAVDEFYKMLSTDELRAYYGPKHVARAVEAGAVGTLLISDSLFRSQDVGERRKWVGIVEEVRKGGGEVLIFSSIHESGKQLDQLTGVAAILNFPLPEVESDDEEEGRVISMNLSQTAELEI